MEKLLERITGLIAAISALIVALSVSHEFGYFAYIGRFFQAFVTASDYFTNAILWMPLATITVIGWQNWKFIWKDTPKIKRYEWKSWILPTIILGLPILTLVFLSDGIPILYLLALIYLWFLFFDGVAPSPKSGSQIASDLRNLIKIGCPICAALFTIGYERAKSDLKATFSFEPYIIQIKDLPGVSLRIPLRNFDKGVLLNDPLNHRIEFIKWDRIESIVKPLDTNQKDPLSCRWFGILCWTNNGSP